MRKWLVRLSGSSLPLQILKAAFGPRGCVLQDDTMYYLTSPRFAAMSDPQAVYTAAGEILDHMNGIAAMFAVGYRPVEIQGEIVQIDEGVRRQHVVVAATTAFGWVIAGPPDPDLVNVAAWLALAERDRNVSAALHFFSVPSWGNLYKVLEIVRDEIGNDDKLARTGWITRRDLSRFTQTAQSRDALGDEARHAAKKYKAPGNPMSLEEARVTIRELLVMWLRSKASSSLEPSTRQMPLA